MVWCWILTLPLPLSRATVQMKLLVADAVATGFLLKNSRDAERQADDLGTENLYQVL